MIKETRIDMATCGNAGCTRPRMVGYTECKGCKISHINSDRRRLNLRLEGHLYVAHTPHGLKIGRSCRPDRRAVELRRQMFAGGDVTLLKVYDDLGHLESSVHYELNDYRSAAYREVFECDLEAVETAIDRLARADE